MRHALLILGFTALTAFGQGVTGSFPPPPGLPSGAALPSTCSIGAAFALTSAGPTAVYTCGPAANQWQLTPASGTPTAANWRGVYAAGTTYAAGDAIGYGTPSVGYVSLVGTNLGNTPSGSPTYWAALGPVGATGAGGATGAAGAAGTSVTASVESPGGNCATGGVKFVSGSGTNHACNGVTGSAGAAGANGTNGIGGTGSQGGGGGGGSSTKNAGGGGGGAGATGGTPPSNLTAGAGGNGIANSISGLSVTYAGGGGGSSSNVGSGGSGGGGKGANDSIAADPGTANLGGGGGGGSSPKAAGNGGAGVVIIAYPIGSLIALGGSMNNVGGYTTHTFTSSGTWTLIARHKVIVTKLRITRSVILAESLAPFGVTLL